MTPTIEDGQVLTEAFKTSGLYLMEVGYISLMYKFSDT